MTILFRVDASSEIGIGHIMRDFVLAKQFPNTKIFFATQELKGNINHKIIESGYEIVNLKTNDKNELLEVLKAQKIDLLVIDHYQIDHNYERYIKEHFNVRILSFDDTYEKHHCDILLNHNISADKKRYKGLVPDNCELRCGTKYTLLREEFFKIRKRKKKRQKKKVIFLSMGGSDVYNYNFRILKLLKKFKNIEVTLATTTANKNLTKLIKFGVKNRWVHVHVNSDNIANLMDQSDFAIITPSVTVNEVLHLKLPFIAFKVIENQDDMHQYLKKKHYHVVDRVSYLEKPLRKLIYA